MNRVYKILILFLFVFLPVVVNGLDYTYKNEKNGYRVLIDDSADILSDTEKSDLLMQYQDHTSVGNVLVTTINNHTYKTTEEVAKSEYKKSFGNTSGYVVCIDFKYNMFWIVSYGDANKYLTNDNIKTITDAYSSYFVNKNYYNGLVQTALSISSVTENNHKLETIVGDYKAIIEDNANLLNEAEEEKLKEYMNTMVDKGFIVFHTVSSHTGSTKQYSENYYYQRFGNANGVMVVIDMQERYVWIVAEGQLSDIITTTKTYSITDNAYKYLTKGKYYEGTYRTFYQINKLLGGEKIPEPMRYTSITVISLTFAALINFIIIFTKTKISKASYNTILKNSIISFGVANIVANKKGTRRVYSPPSSSSSSGGSSFGGSSGGGGGFSGSSGGHRF